ncbi:methyltransferase domain-containing protein [Candidatus Gottesmanbacteria bacterium]|nr:methyltransferase domain-containing protein [Candidatus Gottesmanbacteria bacterium]
MQENNTYQYFFVLGKNPSLSLAEITAVTQKDYPQAKSISRSQEILLLSSKDLLEEKKIQQRLGGTVKIGKIITELNLSESQSDIFAAFSAEKLFLNFFSRDLKKIHFGLSLYFIDENPNIRQNSKKLLMDLSKYIKDELKTKGHSSGFVQIKDRFLSSVSVAKNELLTKGSEIVLIVGKNVLYLGKTETVQDFAEYSWRDYGRPQRDAKRGLLPPKVAKMMINIAKISPSQTLLDPFCGSGTIIQEALLLGFENIIGSDISKDAIEDVKKNIDWLRKQKNNISLNQKVDLFMSDVRNLTEHIPQSSIDVIVTEPYLGPPLKGFINRKRGESIIKNLLPLYKDTFKSFNKILKSQGVVVMIFPKFIINKETISLFSYIKNELKILGFSPKENILYGSPAHFLYREIVHMVKYTLK